MAYETDSAGKTGRRGHGDEPLRALLEVWPVPGPQQAFEAEVWRRIAVSRSQAGRGFGPGWFLRDLGAQPVWTSALATAAAVAVGLWMGLSMPRMRDHQPAPRAILGERTAAGAYLSMAAGEGR